MAEIDVTAAESAYLKFKQPTCPVCGTLGHIFDMGPSVVPIAFCPDDDCRLVQWWPEKSAAENMSEFLSAETRVKLGLRE